MKLCECGCGQQAVNRFVRGHNRRVVLRRLPAERFWTFVERKSPSECWNWTGGTVGGGYGLFRITGTRNQAAHRFSYELLVGPIPDGLTLDHLCRNRSCVNPGHLEPVTMRENLLRGQSFAARNAQKTHCPKGHPYDEENTYWDKKGRACKKCSREHTRRYRAEWKREMA